MPVALLPPVTGGSHRFPDAVPLTEGPRFVRGPRSGRWHRPRAAVRYPGRLVWALWCGPHLFDTEQVPVLRSDETPADGPVCGTCVGRALGAGQDETPTGLGELVFSPRWQEPPRRCPGSRAWDMFDRPDTAHGSVGACLACGDLVAVRSMGGPWNPYAAPIEHVPGPGLVSACPFHAWQHIRRRPDGRAGCVCGWHDEAPAGGDGR
ncbi:hypothetical protein [Verrucosispora sp. WMMC514]|uniref:hypothetical protein n=1 Tax=Verrucosispora sp. WMMC514 TaxID=3015156 RepID=UPI00248AB5BE|nr:hypothetical protein [Verrucosispora sp. WMMC514]WBB94260.1 hypothetical protein O7597_15525 [Verrucosispora sp. WMMC514]